MYNWVRKNLGIEGGSEKEEKFRSLLKSSVPTLVNLLVFVLFFSLLHMREYKQFPTLKGILVNYVELAFLISLPFWIDFAIKLLLLVSNKEWKTKFSTYLLPFVIAEVALFPLSIGLYNFNTFIGMEAQTFFQYLISNYKFFGLIVYPALFLVGLYFYTAQRGAEDFGNE